MRVRHRTGRGPTHTIVNHGPRHHGGTFPRIEKLIAAGVITPRFAAFKKANAWSSGAAAVRPASSWCPRRVWSVVLLMSVRRPPVPRRRWCQASRVAEQAEVPRRHRRMSRPSTSHQQPLAARQVVKQVCRDREQDVLAVSSSRRHRARPRRCSSMPRSATTTAHIPVAPPLPWNASCAEGRDAVVPCQLGRVVPAPRPPPAEWCSSRRRVIRHRRRDLRRPLGERALRQSPFPRAACASPGTDPLPASVPDVPRRLAAPGRAPRSIASPHLGHAASRIPRPTSSRPPFPSSATDP